VRAKARCNPRRHSPQVPLPPTVSERLAGLAPDQRAAATAPPGPVLCVAPAGSGKTTTLVARAAWLIASGVDPGAICAVTFNRRAARELDARLGGALATLGLEPGALRVRTFHALGREILLDAGASVENVVDRASVLAALEGPELTAERLQRLDIAFSRLKLDLAVPTDQLRAAADAAARREQPPGPHVRAFLRYEEALAELGARDFDDLIRDALRALHEDASLLARWRGRCQHLLVDEVQDVDRSQLQLALLLAAPANQVFFVGDDDQTIYAWRLADVRRVLGLAARLPGLRRVDLETNYRCPPAVVARSVRLVSHNVERFTKAIRPAAGATGTLIVAGDPGDDVARARRLLAAWPGGPAGQRAVLARTNAELAPFAAAAIELGIPYAAEDDGLLFEDPGVDSALAMLPAGRVDGDAEAASAPAGSCRPDDQASDVPERGGGVHLLLRELAALAAGPPGRATAGAGALLSWAAGCDDAHALAAAIEAARTRRAGLRTESADLTLATVHGTKGLEFDHVAVVGLDDGRFPNARSIDESAEPGRVLEEERRLAYVAWTRARKSLTLVYDPGAPSTFMTEAFSPEELRVPPRREPGPRLPSRSGAGSASGG